MRKPLVAALLCLPLLSAAAPAVQAAEPRPAVAQAAVSLPDTARATVLQVRTLNVSWDLTSTSPRQLRDSYTAFMRSLRNAAGVVIRGTGDRTVWETRDSDDIVAVNVSLPQNQSVTLYLSVRNLYLRGFSTGAAGNVVQFRDPGFSLAQQLNRHGTTLPYSGHYGGHENGIPGLGNSDAGARHLEINQPGLTGRLAILARYARQGGVANDIQSALVTAIGVTSEAARFRDIEETVREGLGGSATLNDQAVEEENDWGQGSHFMFEANRVPDPTPTTLGNAHLNNWGDGARYLAMLLITQK
ncbi:ribosome-inactivating family protein [Streptomyces sp. NPDC018019]|uniref:ribosome-inactivating family protein n=1 Tax=Streptomyces sp. NPDC018019 TaxID=3365030 RepID=UPI0037A69AA1